jgi:hypothetical protein
MSRRRRKRALEVRAIGRPWQSPFSSRPQIWQSEICGATKCSNGASNPACRAFPPQHPGSPCFLPVQDYSQFMGMAMCGCRRRTVFSFCNSSSGGCDRSCRSKWQMDGSRIDRRFGKCTGDYRAASFLLRPFSRSMRRRQALIQCRCSSLLHS